MNKEKKPSAGLVFMQAAAAAMPKTLGDRERITAFGAAMSLAIRNRFAFAKEDAEPLLRMSIRTCVGVFRPLDFYLGACIYGGTYAKMWEAHHKQKPWVALKAIAPRYMHENYLHEHFSVLDDNRVTVQMGVLLPQTFDAHDAKTRLFEDMQVWWITSQSDDHITVCRYRLSDDDLVRHGRDIPFKHSGQPFRIRKLTREQWAEWNTAPAEVEEKKAA